MKNGLMKNILNHIQELNQAKNNLKILLIIYLSIKILL